MILLRPEGSNEVWQYAVLTIFETQRFQVSQRPSRSSFGTSTVAKASMAISSQAEVMLPLEKAQGKRADWFQLYLRRAQ